MSDGTVKSFLELRREIREKYKDTFERPCVEKDIRETPWLMKKLESSKVYCQNLYAAFCNNMVIHTETGYDDSTTWRGAGGMIADLLCEGDYMDWYCSGMGVWGDCEGYVGEGVVTDVIREDLKKIGWEFRDYPKELFDDL